MNKAYETRIVALNMAIDDACDRLWQQWIPFRESKMRDEWLQIRDRGIEACRSAYRVKPDYKERLEFFMPRSVMEKCVVELETILREAQACCRELTAKRQTWGQQTVEELLSASKFGEQQLARPMNQRMRTIAFYLAGSGSVEEIWQRILNSDQRDPAVINDDLHKLEIYQILTSDALAAYLESLEIDEN